MCNDDRRRVWRKDFVAVLLRRIRPRRLARRLRQKFARIMVVLAAESRPFFGIRCAKQVQKYQQQNAEIGKSHDIAP